MRLCGICDEHYANLHCLECRKPFCNSCFGIYHKRTSKKASHTTAQANLCRICEEKRIELMCKQCKKDFCGRCFTFYHKKATTKNHERRYYAGSRRGSETDTPDGAESLRLPMLSNKRPLSAPLNRKTLREHPEVQTPKNHRHDLIDKKIIARQMCKSTKDKDLDTLASPSHRPQRSHSMSSSARPTRPPLSARDHTAARDVIRPPPRVFPMLLSVSEKEAQRRGGLAPRSSLSESLKKSKGGALGDTQADEPRRNLLNLKLSVSGSKSTLGFASGTTDRDDSVQSTRSDERETLTPRGLLTPRSGPTPRSTDVRKHNKFGLKLTMPRAPEPQSGSCHRRRGIGIPRLNLTNTDMKSPTLPSSSESRSRRGSRNSDISIAGPIKSLSPKITPRRRLASNRGITPRIVISPTTSPIGNEEDSWGSRDFNNLGLQDNVGQVDIDETYKIDKDAFVKDGWYIDLKECKKISEPTAHTPLEHKDLSSAHPPLSLDPADLVKLGTLGAGASASVYKAINRKTYEMYALKVINVFDRAKRKMLIKELEAFEVAQKAQFAHIVDYHGAYFSKGATTLALEYMNQGSLQSILKTYGPLKENVIASVRKQANSAGSQVPAGAPYDAPDIKPANILVNDKGQVKLADFGILGILPSSAELASTWVGTKKYMSPERIKSDDYAYNSDIWSLGLVALEMATGEFPIDIEFKHGIIAIMQAICSSPVRELSASRFSGVFRRFTKLCVLRDHFQRPGATNLLIDPFVRDVRPDRRCPDWPFIVKSHMSVEAKAKIMKQRERRRGDLLMIAKVFANEQIQKGGYKRTLFNQALFQMVGDQLGFTMQEVRHEFEKLLVSVSHEKPLTIKRLPFVRESS
eukprot:CAMPEP_0167816010 /NCGR_PEP_ID=MMETSP0112_2-20121227/3349_1 /TAXON_ID=91324 /ORGANISM="Lotharella globosa, Strain CCCM811" /LENGTH=861 /DNA_ID=CAMNT_0007715511 /DNA_START=63 /DNA_END=2649 /DNA_ORIENTATION=+